MAAVILELDPRRRSSSAEEVVVEEIARLERRTFPKHESLCRSLRDEVRKKSIGLLYMKIVGGGGGGGGEDKEDEEVIGYVMYSWLSSLCASITKLAVKEDYRRQGHGEALLKEAIQKCRSRKIQRVCLHVDPARIPAITLYKKLGFEIDALIESYYSSNRNAYRMYLEFND